MSSFIEQRSRKQKQLLDFLWIAWSAAFFDQAVPYLFESECRGP